MAEAVSGQANLPVEEWNMNDSITDESRRSPELQRSIAKHQAELENILTQMALDMKDLDPEYSKVVDENFWSLA